MGRARTFAELKAMSDEELVREHDVTATSTQTGVSYYLDELTRRDLNAQNARIEAMTHSVQSLTRTITWMTGVIVVLTAVSTWFVILAARH